MYNYLVHHSAVSNRTVKLATARFVCSSLTEEPTPTKFLLACCRFFFFMKYTPPKWIGSIPQGTHGSGKVQKKLWKLTSDYVRIRDFYAYGKCISCGKSAKEWHGLQAGHYRAWSVCRGYSKWDTVNIFGQCNQCNTAYDGNSVGKRFAEAIVERHGKKRLEQLENFTNRPLEKLEDHIIVEMIKDIIILMKDLPEQPDYWKKTYEQMQLHN